MRDKSITFLLPGSGGAPSGGVKVILEQANRLASKGFEVHLVYPIYTLVRCPSARNIIGVLKRFLLNFILRDYKCNTWFKLDESVQQHRTISLKYKYMPKTSYYCATSLETAYYLNDYNIGSNRKIYYIQGFENWNLPETYTLRSYCFNMKKIVITTYLKEKVIEQGSDATLINNGFDFEEFGIDSLIEKRNPHIAIMMYSSANQIKRCSDSISAFERVKQKVPDLKVLVFGVPRRPANLPNWFVYYQSPSRTQLRKLYNEAAVFVAASATEGMALPPAEAMICGCAVCCTDIPGFSVYAINDETALMSPVYDIETLASNIITLMEDNELRYILAKKGNEMIHRFTWEKAASLFEEVILSD